MNTLRKILVATDFSEPATRAVERGGQLARTLACELTLLHVVAENRLTQLSSLFHEEVEAARRQTEEAARHALTALSSKVATGLPSTPAVRVANGPVAATIVATAAQDDRELLMLGARGENTLLDFLLGSTAERVLRKNRKSLLVVRGTVEHDYRQVLVPVDFSPNSQAALQLALQIAPRAAITALHVFDAPFEGKLEFAGVSAADIENYRDQGRRKAEVDLHAFLATLPEEQRSRVKAKVEIGYAPGVVLAQARALGCDLIAIGKHGRSPVEEWVLGSVTQHVLRHAVGDVLAVDRID